MTIRHRPGNWLTCVAALGFLLSMPQPGWSQTSDTPAAPPKDLLAGCPVKSEDGKTYRVEFHVAPADRTDVQALELTHTLPAKVRFELNGREIPVPHPTMHYPTLSGIDPAWLKAGDNVLTARVERPSKQPKPEKPGKAPKAEKAATAPSPARMSLLALTSRHATIEIGPILGDFGEEYFTVTGRLRTGQRISYRSSAGPLPAYLAPGNPAAPAVAAPRLPGETFAFAAFGDCRTHPGDWAKVAGAMLKAKPSFVVCTGDLVADGLNDALWEKEFFGPGRELFSRVPLFCVMGNHENNSPAYDDYIYSPGKTGKEHNWSKTIAGVTLIGIDGKEDWSAGGANAKWLEGVLKGAARSRFVFLFTHYPAWSSGSHGAADEKGMPREKTIREAREVILPLLGQYNAQALIAGHDHDYERSEPANLPAVIVTGGGGAPLYAKMPLSPQNPHSKVFASRLHFCQFAVAGDTCTMTVLTPEGAVLDTKVWKARK